MLGSLPSSSIKLTFLRLIFSSILQHVIKYRVVLTSRETKIMGHGIEQLFKRQQESPDSECSTAAGIHFCKCSAGFSFTWNLGALLTFYLNKHVSHFNLATQSLLKGKTKITVGGKPHLIFYYYLWKVTFYYILCFSHLKHVYMFRTDLHGFVAATCFHQSAGTNTIICCPK